MLKKVWKIIVAFVLLVSFLPINPITEASAETVQTIPDGEYSVETLWLYKGAEFSVSKFLDTNASVNVQDGKNTVTIHNISSIITDFKVNGESLEIVDGKVMFEVDDQFSDVTAGISYSAGDRAMSHEFTVKFTNPPASSVEEPKEEEKPVTEPPAADDLEKEEGTGQETSGEKAIPTENAVKVDYEFKADNAFIQGYLSPYFLKPATIVTEKDGTKNVYITITEKMYIANVIQVVKADGTKKDVEIYSSKGEGLGQVRVIKFQLDGKSTSLYIDAESYGQYTAQLVYDLKEEPSVNEPETEQPETEKPETEKPVTAKPGEKAIPTENAVKVDYELKADIEFIQNYLSPYFERPATIVTEADGTKYVYVTITGKMYGANVIQVVKEDGTKEDVEFYSSKGEKLDQVRVIKFPLEGDSTRLYVDSGSYGQYTVELAYIIDEEKEEAPTYEARILTNKGITLSGNLLQGVSLLVSDEVSEEAKKAFEQAAGNGKILDLYNISLSDENGFKGDLVLTFDVDAEDGTVLHVLHYYDGKIEKHEAKVVNGQVSITVKHLSPFAVVSPADDKEAADVETGSGSEAGSNNGTENGTGSDAGTHAANPATGDQANIALYALLLIGSMFLLIRKYRAKTL